MHKFVILVATTIFITFLLSFAYAEDVERRQIIAVKVKTPPKIDGILNDAVWEKTQPSEDFIQTSPNRGKPMNQQTSICILYDDDNIYLGFQCYDTEPDKIFGSEMRRDYDIWEADDHVGFVLDTYHDLRNAYYFATNPMGIRVDSRITDHGTRAGTLFGNVPLNEIRKVGRRSLAYLLVNCAFRRKIGISGASTVFGQFNATVSMDAGHLSKQAISLSYPMQESL